LFIAREDLFPTLRDAVLGLAIARRVVYLAGNTAYERLNL